METELKLHNEMRKQLWISAWCASIRHENRPSMATYSANEALKAFDERFEPSINETK